jgi:hypothetical protein
MGDTPGGRRRASTCPPELLPSHTMSRRPEVAPSGGLAHRGYSPAHQPSALADAVDYILSRACRAARTPPSARPTDQRLVSEPAPRALGVGVCGPGHVCRLESSAACDPIPTSLLPYRSINLSAPRPLAEGPPVTGSLAQESDQGWCTWASGLPRTIWRPRPRPRAPDAGALAPRAADPIPGGT